MHIPGNVKAKDVWDSLKAVCVQQTAGFLIATTRRMFRTIMQSGESVRAHLNILLTCFQLLEQ